MTKIEEIEQKLNECQKALAELKESKKENSGKWKPKEKEEYWYRDIDGDIYSDFWSNHLYDEVRYKYAPVFKTYEECEKYWHFMDTVKEKSYEFSKDAFKEDSKKYYIYYSTLVNDFSVDFNMSGKCFGIVYFKTKEDAWYIIDNFKDELMEYWL